MLVVIVTVPPRGMASRALTARFSSACSSWPRSMSVGQSFFANCSLISIVSPSVHRLQPRRRSADHQYGRSGGLGRRVDERCTHLFSVDRSDDARRPSCHWLVGREQRPVRDRDAGRARRAREGPAHELCERNERGSIRLLGLARRSDRANENDLPAFDLADEQPPRLVQAAMKEWQAVRKVGRRRVFLAQRSGRGRIRPRRPDEVASKRLSSAWYSAAKTRAPTTSVLRVMIRTRRPSAFRSDMLREPRSPVGPFQKRLAQPGDTDWLA